MNTKNLGIIAAVVLVIVGAWFVFGRNGGPSLSMTESVIGRWQSVDDQMLIREFKEGGAVTDWYGGEELTGVWELFNSKTAPPSAFLSNDDEEALYLRMSLTGDERDMLYFLVSVVDSENLELIYLDRGGTVTFTRAE